MDEAEKIMKFLNPKQSQKTMNQYIQDFVNKQKMQQEEINEMLSNDKYINWLIKFTENINSFSDYTWLYNKEILNESDLNNISKLNLLYEGINTYAENNYIYPIVDKYESFYRIKYQNYGFEISVIYGQETIHSARKVPIDENDYFIDFNDILNNKQQNNVNEINKVLYNLAEMIINAYSKGVPIDAIKSTIDKVINEIIWKEKDKSKIKLK